MFNLQCSLHSIPFQTPEVDCTVPQEKGAYADKSEKSEHCAVPSARQMPPDEGGPFSMGPPQRGKILIIRRTDQDLSMNDVSPFIIGKHLSDHVGELTSLRLQKDGCYHIECKNEKQVSSLLNLKRLENGLNIEISEHPTRNYSKNIISSFELKGLNDEEILTELKKTYPMIEKVKRFNKKVDGKVTPTNTFLLTYNTPNPLTEIKIAFNLIKTRTYYPSPFRCFNCLAFGHATEKCKREKKCARCSENHHEGVCVSEIKCAVCKNAHHTLDRECPAKIKETKIIKLKVDKNIAFKEAKTLVEKESKSGYADACKKSLSLEDKKQKEDQKKYEKTIDDLTEKIKQLEAMVEELQKDLEKALKAKKLETDERKKAEREYDSLVKKCNKLEDRIKTFSLMGKFPKEKTLSPKRKTKKMQPLINEKTPINSDEGTDMDDE